MPVPTAFHFVPSQRATLLTVIPLAVKKPPPAYRSAPLTASDRTSPSMPSPSADQFAPSHRAMFFAGSPPAVAKRPPTNSSPVSPIASARTTPLRPFVGPVPSSDQLLPSQEATWLAARTPACAKLPTAYTRPEAVVATAYTVWLTPLLTPLPNGHQFVPSQRTIRLIGLPPA